MGKSGKTSNSATGCRLALDLTSTAVTLFVRSDQDAWHPLGEAVLGADDFSDQIDALRVETLVRGREQDTVLLWLPPEQVITRTLSLAPGSEDAARAEATLKIAADTEFEPAEMTVAMADGDDPGDTLVMGALLQTLQEAQDYGSRWGFPKTLVSTRTEDQRFGPNGPIFAPPTTIARQAGFAMRRLAVAAAILLTVGGTVYGAYNALQPLLEEPSDIRSSGPALASFAVVLDPISPEAAPIDQVRVGGAGSLAIQRLLVPEAERLNAYGTPRYLGPVATRAPAEMAAPGEGAPMQVGGAPIEPAYERPGRLSEVLQVSGPPNANAVRLAIERIRLAGPPRNDGATFATGPSFKPARQPVTEEDNRVAALAPADQTVTGLPDTSADTALPADPETTEPDQVEPAKDETPSTEPEEAEGSPQAPTEMADRPRPRTKEFETTVAAIIQAEKQTEDPVSEDTAAAPDAEQSQDAEERLSDAASLVPDETPETAQAEAEPEADPNAATVFAALQAPAPSKRPKVFERAAKQPVSTRPAIAAVTIPRTVRSAARKVGLSLDETSLIGVIDARSGRRALVRMPSGDYRKVAKGDDLDGWRVNSISREAMRLTRRGQNRTLLLVSR